MDKYELNLIIDQIKKLAAKKDFKEAAQVANGVDWRKMKDWQTLAMLINVQEAAGDLEGAKEMAILAYNRNLGGKKLVYKLTELAIETKDFEMAEDVYGDYEKMAQHDVQHFILQYKLRKAQGAYDNELVEILEDYKEYMTDEKYTYELAELYYKTGRIDECIETCDDFVMFFQDGEYVEKAVVLKKKCGGKLTKSQRELLEKAESVSQEDTVSEEERFEQERERASRHDEMEEALLEDEEGGLRNFFKKAFSSLKVERLDEDEEQEDTLDNSVTEYSEETNSEDAQEIADKVVQFNAEEESKEEKPQASRQDMENLNKASISLKELIENAKKQVEENCEQFSKEVDELPKASEEQAMSQTQDLQKEIAKNLAQFMEEDEKEIAALRPDRIVTDEDSTQDAQDEQLEGQMNLADWVEAVREEKYGKQNTREFSKAELERMLDEKDEKSAAYEKIIEEQKALAAAAGTEYDEEAAKYIAKQQMAIRAVKMDLTIRTGMAIARLEAAQEQAETAAKVQPEVSFTPEQTETQTEEMAEEAQVTAADAAETQTAEPMSVAQEAHIEEIQDAGITESEKTYKFTKKSEPEAVNVMDDLEEIMEDDRKLSPELAKIFRKYKEMPGLESQLVRYFDALEKEIQMHTSSVGNIIISGNSSSDKTDLARTMVRAINHLYPEYQKKIAKTTGDSINNRGLTKALNKLKGTALIVEGAGAIQPKRVKEVLDCLDQDTDRMIVIFEDSDAEMNVLINFNPELLTKFNHRIILKQYTVNELVEMAKKFARKRQYEVDDDALLELYLKIDKLHSMNDNIKIDDIKEIINRAIDNSERRANKKLFGGLKKKRSTSGNITFLSEADFKD